MPLFCQTGAAIAMLLRPMSGTEAPRPDSAPHNGRMTKGGKLSFRGRSGSGPIPDDDEVEGFLIVGGEAPPRLEEIVPSGFDQVEIEVGCGKGAYLVAATEARPDTFLLAIEASPAYARIAAARLKASGRTNGIVLVDNAKLFLDDRVGDAALDRLHVYYPDPWPKRRHRRRRFFTEDMLDVMARVIADDGYLLVATDNAAYAGQICRVLGDAPDLAFDAQETARLQEQGPGHGFSPTNFERKYLVEGRVLRRYAFRRVPEEEV